MNERQIVNKIIHTYVEVNKHEDYTDYKGLITALINWKNEQLTLTDVGSSFSIGFAQYIAKEHYTLVNQIGKIHYWKNEEFSKTTEQLLKDYKETLT